MIDFSADSSNVVLYSDVDILMQQIDMLFDTSPKTVLGYEDYGTEYDRYLYDLRISGDNLKSRIESDLYSLDLQGFTPTVQVHLLQGTEQDIAIIDITLRRQSEQYEKIYKIS